MGSLFSTVMKTRLPKEPDCKPKKDTGRSMWSYETGPGHNLMAIRQTIGTVDFSGRPCFRRVQT